MNAIHYTSWLKSLSIRRSGLSPRTPFVVGNLRGISTSSPVAKTDKYIVAIPESHERSWLTSDLGDELLKKGKFAFTFCVTNFDGVFVREHYFTTEDHSRAVLGYNCLERRSSIFGPNIAALQRLGEDYLKSTQPATLEAVAKMKLPELWIPYKITPRNLGIQYRHNIMGTLDAFASRVLFG